MTFILRVEAKLSCCQILAYFLLDLLFSPEDEGDMFLRKVG
jgi:hypothetical protein